MHPIEEQQDSFREDLVDAMRRLWLLAVVGFVATVLGFASAYAPAYTANVSGAQVEYETMSYTAPVSFTVTKSAVEIARVAPSRSGSSLTLGHASVPPTTAGYPTPYVMLLTSFALLATGVVLRFSVVQFLAVPVAVYAMRGMVTFRSVIENPYTGGEHVTPEWGMSAFNVAATFMICVALVATVQTIVVNQRERTLERAKADARGERADGGILDVIGTVMASAIERYQRPVEALAAAGDGDDDKDNS